MILSQYIHTHSEISGQVRYCSFKDIQAGDVHVKVAFTMQLKKMPTNDTRQKMPAKDSRQIVIVDFCHH